MFDERTYRQSLGLVHGTDETKIKSNIYLVRANAWELCTHKKNVREKNAHLITSVLNLSTRKVKRKYRDSVWVLIGNDQELAAVIKLEVARSLSTCVKEAHLGQCASHTFSFGVTAALFYAEDGNGIMASVGDYDESSWLVYA